MNQGLALAEEIGDCWSDKGSPLPALSDRRLTGDWVLSLRLTRREANRSEPGPNGSGQSLAKIRIVCYTISVGQIKPARPGAREGEMNGEWL